MDTNVEAVIGNLHTVSRLPQAEQEALRLVLIRQNFTEQYERNGFFRAQCEAAGVTPDSLRTPADLKRIPLIPVRTFKQPTHSHVLMSVPLTAIDLEIRSTGTSGIPSVARRDVLTTTRTVQALVAQYREFFGICNGAGLFLCPSTAESPEMGLVKVFNLFCGLLDDRTYLVKDYSFQAEEAVEYLESWAHKMTRHIFGPPFLINRLLRYMEAEDIRLELDAKSFVITLGGWKRFNGENIGREAFDQKLQELLGVRKQNIRDMYGLIESNMLAIECEHHQKHVPPWCYISVRDVSDNSVEVPVGRTGAIGIIDPLSNSYPAYVLTEDVGELVREGECPCGRVGQVLTFHRRLHGAELGCCAVSIERFIEEQEEQLVAV
jgi:long-chain-fatty-acid---luciferin-component ligase